MPGTMLFTLALLWTVTTLVLILMARRPEEGGRAWLVLWLAISAAAVAFYLWLALR